MAPISSCPPHGPRVQHHSRHVRRGRPAPGAARRTRHSLHGRRRGRQPARVRQDREQEALRRGRCANGEMGNRREGRRAHAAVAIRCEAAARGLQRRRPHRAGYRRARRGARGLLLPRHGGARRRVRAGQGTHGWRLSATRRSPSSRSCRKSIFTATRTNTRRARPSISVPRAA